MKLFALFFLCGTTSTAFFDEKALISGVLSSVLVLLGWGWLRRSSGAQYSQYFSVSGVAIGTSGILAGVYWSASALSGLQAQALPATLDGREVIVTGSIAGLPFTEPGRVRFDFKPLKIWVADPADGSGVATATQWTGQGAGTWTFRVSWYGDGLQSTLDRVEGTDALRAGQRWSLRLKLRKPRTLMNPGGFDYAQHLFVNRIQAVATVQKSPSNVPLIQTTEGLSPTRLTTRERLNRTIADLSDSLTHTGLMRGLLVGVRDGIDQPTWELLRRTGTSHLLAISGLHIGLVALWGYGIGCLVWRFVRLSGFPRRLTRPDFASIVALSVAGLYAALAGFTLPTQRALIMLGTLFCWRFVRRQSDPLQTLAIAALVILLFDPLVTLSAGFWLSFGAVAILMIFSRRGSTVISRFLLLLRLHVILGLLLMPMTVAFFSEASLIAPIANTVAIPWVSVVTIPSLLLWALLHPVIESHWLLDICDWSLACLLWFLSLLDTQLPVALSLPGLPLLSLLSMTLALLVIALPSGVWPRRYAIPLLAPVVLLAFSPSVPAGLRVTVLDVGQGLSVVVRTSTRTLVFDTGGRLSRERSLASAVVIPYLQNQGVRAIDALVLSHADADHAAGATDLIGEIPTEQVIGSYSEHPVMQRCVAGESWVWDRIEFTFVHPAATDQGNRNNLSCSLLIKFGKSSVLLPGDIEQAGESRLMDRLASRQAVGELWDDSDQLTLLVAPHHGSKTSSTMRFLNGFRPQVVVYSIGYRNRFGFPHESVQMRYKLHCTRELRTDDSGAITVDLDSSGRVISLQRYRCAYRRPWLDPCGDADLIQHTSGSSCSNH